MKATVVVRRPDGTEQVLGVVDRFDVIEKREFEQCRGPDGQLVDFIAIPGSYEKTLFLEGFTPLHQGFTQAR